MSDNDKLASEVASNPAGPLGDRPEVVRVKPQSTRWFGRSDRRLFRVLAVLAPFATAFPFLLHVSDWINGQPIRVASSGEVVLPNILPRLPRLELYDPSATIFLKDPTAGERLAAMMPSLLNVLAVTVVSLLLIRISRDIARGYAFSAGNITRVRVLGFLVAWWGVLYSLMTAQIQSWLMGGVSGVKFETSIDTTVMWLAIGVGFSLSMLSQAFTVGRDLADEASEAI